MAKRTVLFYAVNGLGLGHVTRTLSIARQMVQLDPDIRPYFFSSSDAAHVIGDHGFEYTKVPSKTTVKATGGSYSELQIQYQMSMLNLIQSLRPKALIVDTFPLGSADDLAGVLTIKRRSMKKIFIHREQRPEKMNKRRIALQNFYDLVIAPHQEGKARIPVPAGVELFWAGHIMIRSQAEILSRKEALARMRVPTDKKVVLVNMGGGGDVTTAENYRNIFASLGTRKDLHLVLLDAPLQKYRLDLPPNATMIKYYPLVELMQGFDAAISAAGYNTFHELLATGTPTIFVPKMRGYDDQNKRVQEAVAQTACLCSSENFELHTNLTNILYHKETFSHFAKQFVPENGAVKAAQKILETMI